MTTLKAPELLLPAGSLDKMRAAYDFGADAVYAGQPRYSPVSYTHLTLPTNREV